MGKTFDKDTAEQARNKGEFLRAVMGSDLGKQILEDLDKIEAQAVKGAFLGETPENTNILMERRGEYRTAQRIRNIFNSVTKEEEDALKWQAENAPVAPPASDKKA